jgi:hypothetical protein
VSNKWIEKVKDELYHYIPPGFKVCLYEKNNQLEIYFMTTQPVKNEPTIPCVINIPMYLYNINAKQIIKRLKKIYKLQKQQVNSSNIIIVDTIIISFAIGCGIGALIIFITGILKLFTARI